MLNAEERGPEAPPAPFPPWQPERAKVRARPKRVRPSWEAGLALLFHVFLGAELCGGAPHTCREAPGGFDFSAALLGSALLAQVWPDPGHSHVQQPGSALCPLAVVDGIP